MAADYAPTEESERAALPFWHAAPPPPTPRSHLWATFQCACGVLTPKLIVSNYVTACDVAISILLIQRWWRKRLGEKKGWPSLGVGPAGEPPKGMDDEGVAENFFRIALRAFGAHYMEETGIAEEAIRTAPVRYHISFPRFSETVVHTGISVRPRCLTKEPSLTSPL